MLWFTEKGISLGDPESIKNEQNYTQKKSVIKKFRTS